MEQIFDMSKKPKTKLLFNELLGHHSILQLAKYMNVTYTKLYPYKKEGANPTLLGLEELAKGFSLLLGKEVRISDLVEGQMKPEKIKKRVKN